jgi:hypothetical protein
MPLSKTIEQLHFPGPDRLMLGATLMAAAAHLVAQEVAATRADKEQIDEGMLIETHPSDEGDAVLLFDVGLFQDPAKVKQRLGPRVEHLGPSYFLKHAPDVNVNRNEELKILEREKGRKIVTISTSKGGLDRVRMMADPTFAQEHDYVTLSSFDSAPFITSHLKARGKLLAWGGLMLPDSHLSSVGFNWRSATLEKKRGESFVRSTGPQSFYEAKNDARVLMSTYTQEEAIREAFDEEHVGSIIAVAAAKDRLVNTGAAANWLQRATGRVVLHHIDTNRKKGDHAGITDEPDFQIRQIERYLAGSEAYSDELETA